MNAPVPPLIIDVRAEDACTPLKGAIPNAIRRDPGAAATWALDLDLGRKVIVYCAHGEERSQGIAKSLCGFGIPAQFLKGGFEAWSAGGGAIAAKPAPPSVWVTRERPKIDASPVPG